METVVRVLGAPAYSYPLQAGASNHIFFLDEPLPEASPDSGEMTIGFTVTVRDGKVSDVSRAFRKVGIPDPSSLTNQVPELRIQYRSVGTGAFTNLTFPRPLGLQATKFTAVSPEAHEDLMIIYLPEEEAKRIRVANDLFPSAAIEVTLGGLPLTTNRPTVESNAVKFSVPLMLQEN